MSASNRIYDFGSGTDSGRRDERLGCDADFEASGAANMWVAGKT